MLKLHKYFSIDEITKFNDKITNLFLYPKESIIYSKLMESLTI